MRIDKSDLEWWLDLYPKLEWTWATTYAEKAPHHYVIRGKTISMRDGWRLINLIKTFGEPQMYWRMMNIYLVAEGRKWWYAWDWEPDHECRAINMAPADQFFGTQSAPSTVSGRFGVYDTLCTDYDQIATRAHDDEIKSILSDYIKNPWPRTLDVGAGTGRLLDLDITTQQQCTVVDPSQGMLNALLRKRIVSKEGSNTRGQVKLDAVYPARIEDCYQEFEPKSFDLVASLYGSISYVRPEVVSRLPMLSSGLTVLMSYKPGYLPEWWQGWPLPETVDEVAALVKTMGGERFDLGNYWLDVIENRTQLF